MINGETCKFMEFKNIIQLVKKLRFYKIQRMSGVVTIDDKCSVREIQCLASGSELISI